MLQAELQLVTPTEQDIPALVAFQQTTYRKEATVADRYEATMLNTFRENVLARIDDEAAYQRMVAVDNQVVAYAAGILYEACSDRARWISLDVLEDMRGNGIGSMMLRDFDAAVAPGVMIGLTVLPNNTGARRLYERHGYVDDPEGKITMIKQRGQA